MTTRHNITVTALNGKYYLDGVEAPILDLISGHTYIFDLSDASLSTHPFRLKLNNTEWGDNVVLTNSTLTLEVPSTSLGSLSYFCTNHAGMGNHFNIIPNQINGDDQNNILTGLFGDDIITGGLGEDIIFGKDGDDTIITDSHGNYMYGGAGNDTILILEKTQSGIGFPKILLGEGNDFIDVKDELTWLKLNFEKWWLSTPELTFWSETDSPIIEGILINGLDIPFEIAGQTLQPNTVKDAFGKIDQISKLRGFSAFGTQFDDIAVTDDWLFWETSLGNDTILMPFGKNGIFKIENYWIDAAVNWDLSQKYFIFTDSDGKQHSLSVDNLVNDIDLGNNNDTLHGNALDNVIRGRGGNDNLDGADGDDTLDGGDGDDIIRGGDGDDIIYTGGANDRDRIYGDEGDDTIIKTGNGSLSVYGGAGNDIIDLQGLGIGSYANVRPNMGANTIIGPETKWNANDDGAELYYDDVEGVGGIVATFSSPGTGTVTSRNAGFINDNFTFVSRIRGTSDDDHFIGSDNERWEGWEGFAGNDLIEAGGGFDELLYHQSYQGGGSGAATVNFATGTALDPFGDTDNFSGIEAVRGTAKNDVFIGSSTQEYIRYRGLDGADTFIGTSSWDQANYERDEKYGGTSGIIADLAAGTIQDGFGAIDTVSLIDEVKGTEFDDIISSDGVSFHQRLWGNGGDDTITGGDSDDIIKGGDGNDIIRGGDGDDVLYTGSGDDRVFGEAGDDTIIQDGSGTQFYDGGLGSDTIEVDTYGWVTLNNSYPQIVDINLSTGNMGQKDNPNRRDTFTSIENITFKGNFDAELTGDSNANIIRGGDGNDIIRGGDGDDVLYTGSGDDFLYGEEGNDTLISNGGGSQTLDGGSGQDWFRQDLTNYDPTNLNINYPQIVEIDLARGLAGQKDNPNR
ncbi:MAG: calcium-binding protein, partial [Alphaproteobacteria bacterium]|nr:calcium-binding protein [Alphaproteobacteria bacterium]